VDVITGVIRSNLPARIAFAVKTATDARIITGEAGAEKLLGKGDMLFQTQSMPDAVRLQGVFISNSEIAKIVDYVRDNNEAYFDSTIDTEINTVKADKIEKDVSDEEDEGRGTDKIFVKAVTHVISNNTATISNLQRKFSVGYSRAARLIDTMEEKGIVSRTEGNKPRSILMTMNQFREQFYDLFRDEDMTEEEDDGWR
jgi:S-DNA-T family DNA segregation ATPase FtsK/SpoIIIE